MCSRFACTRRRVRGSAKPNAIPKSGGLYFTNASGPCLIPASMTSRQKAESNCSFSLRVENMVGMDIDNVEGSFVAEALRAEYLEL